MGIAMEHFYQSLEGENWFDYQQIYLDAVKNATHNESIFVEIGSWKGKSASFMGVEIINSGKPIKFYCIDDWSLGGTRDNFMKNTAPISSVLNVIEGLSWESARLFSDKSIDFCFIDGAHDYDSVTKDIISFIPKMKPGGLICGHDYTSSMDGDNKVYDAVNDIIGKNNIQLIANVWLFKTGIL